MAEKKEKAAKPAKKAKTKPKTARKTKAKSKEPATSMQSLNDAWKRSGK